MAPAVQAQRAQEAHALEATLGGEASANWARALAVAGVDHAPPEVFRPTPVAFYEANPTFMASDDVWSRQLSLRPMEDAMKGNLAKPLEPPVVHPEDHMNFQEGKYKKDDCPIL